MSGWSHSAIDTRPTRLAVDARVLGELQNPVGRKRADRQVVVAGPAKAAQVRAASHHLDEKARSEFGVGRENAGRRRIDGFGGLERGLPHRDRRVRYPVTSDSPERAVGRVLRLIERRNVKTAFGGQQAQEVAAVGGLKERAPQRRHQHFALAGGDHVGEQRQRLGIDEGHGAADDDQRMPGRALRGVARHAGQAKQREHVDVVPFERHGEGNGVEFVDHRLRFERHERRLARHQLRQLLLGRQEHALADNVLLVVEQAVHGLEPQVRHPDPVRCSGRRARCAGGRRAA